MQFALIGFNAETPPLLDALTARGHRLTHICDAEGLPGSYAAGAQLCSWESLLGADIDAAVVVSQSGGQPASRDNVLRRLAQAPVPLLLVHPVCESITGFELDMIRRDTGCVMTSYFPAACHPSLLVLRQYVEEAEAGAIDQIAIERSMADRSRGNVLWHLARDAYMLRVAGGEITSVTGIRPGESWSNFSVTTSGAGDMLSKWSMLPVEEPAGATLQIRGAGGTMLLEAPDTGPWRISGPGMQSKQIIYKDWQPAALAVDAFCAEIESQPSPLPMPLPWMEVCRALEVAETAGYSATRGRTIHLYLQEHTEQSTFKGMMAAGGCLALLLTFAAFIAVLVIDGAQPPFRNEWWWRMWPTVVATPVVFFLLLQGLQLLFKATPPGNAADNDAGNK